MVEDFPAAVIGDPDEVKRTMEVHRYPDFGVRPICGVGRGIRTGAPTVGFEQGTGRLNVRRRNKDVDIRGVSHVAFGIQPECERGPLEQQNRDPPFLEHAANPSGQLVHSHGQECPLSRVGFDGGEPGTNPSLAPKEPSAMSGRLARRHLSQHLVVDSASKRVNRFEVCSRRVEVPASNLEPGMSKNAFFPAGHPNAQLWIQWSQTAGAHEGNP
jgi:hypothetical protein